MDRLNGQSSDAAFYAGRMDGAMSQVTGQYSENDRYRGQPGYRAGHVAGYVDAASTMQGRRRGEPIPPVVAYGSRKSVSTSTRKNAPESSQSVEAARRRLFLGLSVGVAVALLFRVVLLRTGRGSPVVRVWEQTGPVEYFYPLFWPFTGYFNYQMHIPGVDVLKLINVGQYKSGFLWGGAVAGLMGGVACAVWGADPDGRPKCRNHGVGVKLVLTALVGFGVASLYGLMKGNWFDFKTYDLGALGNYAESMELGFFESFLCLSPAAIATGLFAPAMFGSKSLAVESPSGND